MVLEALIDVAPGMTTEEFLAFFLLNTRGLNMGKKGIWLSETTEMSVQALAAFAFSFKFQVCRCSSPPHAIRLSFQDEDAVCFFAGSPI
jgi:hypothetical protein